VAKSCEGILLRKADELSPFADTHTFWMYDDSADSYAPVNIVSDKFTFINTTDISTKETTNMTTPNATNPTSNLQPGASDTAAHATTVTSTLKDFFTGTALRAKSALAEELPNAGWRIIGRQAIDRSYAPILKMMVRRKVLTPSTAKKVTEVLETTYGSGAYGLAVGTLLSAYPRFAARPEFARVASEMRTEGWSRLGSTLVDPVLDVFTTLVENLLEDAGLGIEVAEVREPARFAGIPAPVSGVNASTTANAFEGTK
jgi:hypothetical protein